MHYGCYRILMCCDEQSKSSRYIVIHHKVNKLVNEKFPENLQGI